MKIIRGKIPGAKKVVVYGPEGIGKSTFASYFPDPIFIDTEGSTKDMDVARLPEASSWQMLQEQVVYVKNNPGICRTLVVDTIDWAEAKCVEHICTEHQKRGIEDFGYGNGYVYAKEEFGRFLNRLSGVVDAGINVVLTAHAQIRKFEQTDEMGAYDRYELKLGKKTSSQTSPLVKEWADMLLFANYKTYSVSVDDKGKKHKAQGGARMMYTQHHPCWDAKNRYGLPDELPFEYEAIAHIFTTGKMEGGRMAPAGSEALPEPGADRPIEEDSSTGTQKGMPLGEPDKKKGEDAASGLDPEIPKALRELMESGHVDEWEVRNVVAARGYFTADVPVQKYNQYEPGFVEGCLVAAWPQVFSMIKEMREKEEIPFN
nr:ATP-binding protein [uncultured Acetatifactor sp.]